MKLLNKISLLYLLFAAPVIAVCSVISYNMIFKEVVSNTDERLMKDYEQVKEWLKCDTIVSYVSVNGEIVVVETGGKPENTQPVLSDTTMYDNYEEELLPFRVLRAKFSTPHHNYWIVVGKVYLESEDLVDGIVTSVITLFILLIAGFFAINYFVARQVMKPFYKTLALLGEYDVSRGGDIRFTPVRTKEFRQLNEALNKMTEKIYSDYISQKQFAENASHEMQTPLAVIKNKIELLIQSKNITESDMSIIQSIYNSANKLSQLNKTLLLLAKIENRQFAELKEINLAALVDKMLVNYADMIEQRQVKVTKDLPVEVTLKMNTILADVLIGNLIQNAIRHNITGGSIRIKLTPTLLEIANTGVALNVRPEELFERFRKNDPSTDSIGLGMAIIKQVCDMYGFKITYTFGDNIHTVTVQF